MITNSELIVQFSHEDVEYSFPTRCINCLYSYSRQYNALIPARCTGTGLIVDKTVKHDALLFNGLRGFVLDLGSRSRVSHKPVT